MPLGATLNNAYSASECNLAELIRGFKMIWLQVQLVSALSGDRGERGVEGGRGQRLVVLVGTRTAFIQMACHTIICQCFN